MVEVVLVLTIYQKWLFGDGGFVEVVDLLWQVCFSDVGGCNSDVVVVDCQNEYKVANQDET